MTTVSCQEQTVTVLESDGREGQTGEPKAWSSHLAELLGWLVAMVMTPDPQSVLLDLLSSNRCLENPHHPLYLLVLPSGLRAVPDFLLFFLASIPSKNV